MSRKPNEENLPHQRPAQKTQEETCAKTQRSNPTESWGYLAKVVFYDLHNTSWIQNVVVGGAYLLIALGLGVMLHSKQLAILAIAAGMTVIFWIFVIGVVIRIGRPSKPTTSTEMSDEHPNISSSNQGGNNFTGVNHGTVNFGSNSTDAKVDALSAKMDAYFNKHVLELQKEFPFGCSIFTMKGRNELVPFNSSPWGGATFKREKASVEASNDFVRVKLPEVVSPRIHISDCSATLSNQVGSICRIIAVGEVGLVVKMIDTNSDERLAVVGLEKVSRP